MGIEDLENGEDVIITKTMMESFENLIAYAQWIANVHPEIPKEYEVLNGKR